MSNINEWPWRRRRRRNPQSVLFHSYVSHSFLLTSENTRKLFSFLLCSRLFHWLNKQEKFRHENKFILCVIKIPKRSIDHKLQIKKRERRWRTETSARPRWTTKTWETLVCHLTFNQLRQRLSRKEAYNRHPPLPYKHTLMSYPFQCTESVKSSKKWGKGDWESLSKVINPTSPEICSVFSVKAFLEIFKRWWCHSYPLFFCSPNPLLCKRKIISIEI